MMLSNQLSSISTLYTLITHELESNRTPQRTYVKSGVRSWCLVDRDSCRIVRQVMSLGILVWSCTFCPLIARIEGWQVLGFGGVHFSPGSIWFRFWFGNAISWTCAQYVAGGFNWGLFLHPVLGSIGPNRNRCVLPHGSANSRAKWTPR
jgi:hypothetical protein